MISERKKKLVIGCVSTAFRRASEDVYAQLRAHGLENHAVVRHVLGSITMAGEKAHAWTFDALDADTRTAVDVREICK